MNINCVILCGGSGSRLWPLSRESIPKQLLSLTNEYTMLQNTILRAQSISCTRIYIICNTLHSFLIEKQIKELPIDSSIITIISEPLGRDSAPAVCIASLLGTPSDYTIVMPSDHIVNQNEFIRCSKEAIPLLDTSIVTFGITPSRVETGYGYIKIDEYNNTVQFVEKPTYDIATEYVQSGNYVWNAGLFAFKNDNMIRCMEQYAPDILTCCRETISKSNVTLQSYTLHDVFRTCRSISIDYAVMEPLCKDITNSLLKKTISFHGYWNDIGSFQSLYEENKSSYSDKHTNVIKHTVDPIIIDSSGCYIQSDCPVALVHVHDLVIVQTTDSLLVCNKNHTQDVKKVVDQVKQKYPSLCKTHRKVYRPWGWYMTLHGDDNGPCKVKHIGVYPGKRLSLQSHNHRSEHWVITSGHGTVQVGKDFHIVHKNTHIYIPKETIHRIENTGDSLLEFTETQLGDYLGEDDIIRYEDDFGRV